VLGDPANGLARPAACRPGAQIGARLCDEAERSGGLFSAPFWPAPDGAGRSNPRQQARGSVCLQRLDLIVVFRKPQEPLRGLEIARMVGHMTYLSSQALQTKFGRRRRGETRQFEIDSYFEYQGHKFARQYDANSYIRVQAAMDEMDLAEQYGSLEDAFAKWRGKSLLVSFDTDWLFPVKEVERVEHAMRANGTAVRHEHIASPNGHDTFLIDYDLITPPAKEFLAD